MIVQSRKTGLKQQIPNHQWDDMKKSGDAAKFIIVSWEEEPKPIEAPEVKPAPQIERVIKKNTKRKPRAKK